MSRRQQPVRTDFRSRETGGVRKKWKDKLPIALVFPNRYRLGMSNLGFQLVYELLNNDPDVVCERVFLPEDSTEQPLSVESGRPLRDFPLIFCSLSFEDDFPNLLRMLVDGGISPLAAARRNDCATVQAGVPLVVAGGVATFINPEPLADFVDLFVLGEAEAALPPVLAFLKGKVVGSGRDALLLGLAVEVAGCYV
ncbi:MAG: radical SAM protein, partial [Desulfobulbaceae bacterium]|nr:radical SAM protein [Desulfobulbaceae bacterium]